MSWKSQEPLNSPAIQKLNFELLGKFSTNNQENLRKLGKTLNALYEKDGNFWVVDSTSEKKLLHFRRQFEDPKDPTWQGRVQDLVGDSPEDTSDLLQELLRLGVDPKPFARVFLRQTVYEPGSYIWRKKCEEMVALCDAYKWRESEGKDPFSNEENSPQTIAELAASKKWWLIQNIVRRRIVSESEVTSMHFGRTAIEWAQVHGEIGLAKELAYLLRRPSVKPRPLQRSSSATGDKNQASIGDNVTWGSLSTTSDQMRKGFGLPAMQRSVTLGSMGNNLDNLRPERHEFFGEEMESPSLGYFDMGNTREIQAAERAGLSKTETPQESSCETNGTSSLKISNIKRDSGRKKLPSKETISRPLSVVISSNCSLIPPDGIRDAGNFSDLAEAMGFLATDESTKRIASKALVTDLSETKVSRAAGSEPANIPNSFDQQPLGRYEDDGLAMVMAPTFPAPPSRPAADDSSSRTSNFSNRVDEVDAKATQSLSASHQLQREVNHMKFQLTSLSATVNEEKEKLRKLHDRWEKEIQEKKKAEERRQKYVEQNAAGKQGGDPMQTFLDALVFKFQEIFDSGRGSQLVNDLYVVVKKYDR